MNEVPRNIFTGTKRRTPWPRLAAAIVITVAASVLAKAQSLPQVRIDADGLAPRPIEELTATTIVRNYALAWSSLATALESGGTARLGEQFVGAAKDRLVRRVNEQNQTGVHVRILDHGHQLKAIFYSTDGTAMQLVDTAQLEVQTFDGSRLLDTQSVPHQYVVLMTPGADRWYIRDLQEVFPKSF